MGGKIQWVAAATAEKHIEINSLVIYNEFMLDACIKEQSSVPIKFQNG